MIDWVFCNKCSLKFQSNIKLYLSECGHIFCEKCIEKLKQTRKCVICNKPTSVMELSKDMDFTTQVFFWPLENLLQQSLQAAGYDPPNPFITSTPANTSKPVYDNNLSMLSSIRFTPSQRIYYQEKKGAGSVNSSTYRPSPAQMVPKGYPVPVHREISMQNPAAVTPTFMEKLRGKPGLSYPRK